MMSVRALKSVTTVSKQVASNLFLIIVGSALCAVAVNGILIPHQFVSGGLTGLSLTVHYMFPALPVYLLYLILNVPIYAMGWRFVGRRFFLYSIGGLMIFAGALKYIQISIPVHDPLLGALLAGIISGAGSGIILRSMGSAGGVDILSVILYKAFSIRLGTTMLVFNSMVLIAAAILFSIDRALYTLIYLFITSYMVNYVVTGLSQRKAVYIISPQWKKISRGILDELNRGVTIFRGQGGYTGKEQRLIYTVITFREIAQLKRVLRQIDPEAFVVVSETLEVMGARIGNQPQW
jgi:uncharacterized membrane-anchored protein YitT (DUF2179 family)